MKRVIRRVKTFKISLPDHIETIIPVRLGFVPAHGDALSRVSFYIAHRANR
jgi:hypothetical protein